MTEEEGLFGISFQEFFKAKGYWKKQKLLKSLKFKERGQFLKAFDEWRLKTGNLTLAQKLQKREQDRKQAEEWKRAELEEGNQKESEKKKMGVKKDLKEIGENPLVWVWHNKGKALLGLVIFCFIVGILASIQPPETSTTEPTVPETVSGIRWTQGDTDRFVSDTNRIVKLLKTPILEGDIEVLEARLPLAKNVYNDTTDWLYDTDWQMNSVPQWVWELDSANWGLILKTEIILDCDNEWLMENELENARCFNLNEIAAWLEDRPTTAKEVETEYRKIQRLGYDCRGWEYDW